jgi:hypothetical protein
VEYNVEQILALLSLCNPEAKGYDSSVSSQLSCLYSTETVLSFFEKLSTAAPTPPVPDATLSPASLKKHKHHITSSIFSFFGLSSEATTSKDGGKYSMLPMEMEDLSIKELPPSEVIDVNRLADIVEVFLSTYSLSKKKKNKPKIRKKKETKKRPWSHKMQTNFLCCRYILN